MKALSKLTNLRRLRLVTLACLILAGSVTAFAVLQTRKGKAVTAVTVVSENENTFIASTSFQNLAGAKATIAVPAGKVQLVQAEFTAESVCQGAFPQNWCSVRILADGVEMAPTSFDDPTQDFAFDAVGLSDDFYEAHAMQRSILLGAGTHTIQVQAAVTLAGMGFFLDDWSLTITQYNNGR